MGKESAKKGQTYTGYAAEGFISAALSGSLSGAAISACVQPLDVIRTRMQADATKNALSGAMGTFRKIVAQDGVRSLWNGTGPTIIRLSMGLGLQMSVLEGLKEALRWQHLRSADQEKGRHPERLTKLEAFLSGGLARTVAAAATCPFTVVKTRMEFTGSGQPVQGMVSMMVGIAKRDGAVGFFRGLGPTIVTNAPYSAFYYLFYTSLKERLQQHGGSQTTVNFSSGTIAAIAATLLTQPTDMLRTHMQLQLGGKGTALGLQDTWRAVVGGRMGHRALLVGVLPRALKRTLQTALVWTLYEELQPRLKQAFMKAE
ncbi:hypothetical protein CVIRNUC_007397 [Coccomyxa viridis]|uniref:Uncharacterized protein n=1 Tax=Coccomyxa viridis TaxID=1274662 RepID=A0AAV1IAG0_9CHLO|nr:hypothetical protein CVIRNUC_007397 [Coccomyxa viridis]